ncbi:unnamed protein product [Phaedon cochleariae]|uniref:Peptidase S1 domain-containing protein n=1 Tax=Phaedon cochleariae TaxID=80249 RepID=A0A9N9SL50_PHACE|nr:unnamed protein product [Phaedon cochleariae]
MVAPKFLLNSDKQNSDGDKSPSPEPFREPEDLVSIDLHNERKSRKNSKSIGDKEVKYKEKVFKILVLVFVFNIIILMIFAVMVYLNEEKYLFKTKPLSLPIFNRAGEQIILDESVDPLEDMILRCLDQNSLSVCCDFFKNAETSFNLDEWCELDNMISSMDIDVRRKRELKRDAVPEAINQLMYTDNNVQDHPEYYDFDYEDHNKMYLDHNGNIINMDYNNDGDGNRYIDYGYQEQSFNYQGYPNENENLYNIPSPSPFTSAPLPYEFPTYQRNNGQHRSSANIEEVLPKNDNEAIIDKYQRLHEPEPKFHYNSDSRHSQTTTEDIPYSVSFNLDFPEEQLIDQVINESEYTSEIVPTSNHDDLHVQTEEVRIQVPEKIDHAVVDAMKTTTKTIPSSDGHMNKYNSDTMGLEISKIESSSSTEGSPLIDEHFQSSSEAKQPSGSNNSHSPSEYTDSTIHSLDSITTNEYKFHEESITNIHSTTEFGISDDRNFNSREKMDQISDKHRANEAEENRSKITSEYSSPTVEMQSNLQAMFNPCFSPYPNPFYNPYKMALPAPYDGNQVMKVIQSNNQKAPQFILNPPMYPYMQPSYLPTQQYMPNYWQQTLQQSQSQNTHPIQVSGPGGQFYVCNPIPPVTNNIASVSGIEVRRESYNLQDMLADIPEEFKASNKSREAPILCPLGQQSCEDGSKCIPKHHVCDNEAHCEDGSDEMFCTCKDRVGKLRTCDGYFDCPDGQDELGCFGCEKDEFSCDDWSRFRKSTCIPIEHRCDGIRQCEITGKDEEDCSVLADNVGDQPQFKISNSVGFLHRNYKGKWYPTCFGTDLWATEICQTESGPTSITPRSHMMLTTNNYDGHFINILPNNNINLVKNCVQDRAAFVECPPLFCGLRMTINNPYRPQEVDTSAENLINDMERGAEVKKENVLLGNSRVVGGKPSQPAAWPWLVSIYKNGIFHCGGVLINEMWIVTAAHCVDKYWLYYYEIQAGMLRRFSYAPMEQHRWAAVIIANENYDKSTLENDIALMKLSSPVRFNRYVRPICLPSEATAGRNFMEGPSPGTICTTVGWGATIEHGSDPDHMREVEVPITKQCKHPDDKGGDEICAGLSEGGKDACQGDSGGPLMCRNPNDPSQWHLAGIVSHGEGCARPDEPGVYTKVSRYVGWIAENIGSERFSSNIPLQSCPGYICRVTNQCLPKKHHCDKIVDCLFGDDESSCKHSFHNIFKHSRRNPILAKTREENDEKEEETTGISTDSEDSITTNESSTSKTALPETNENATMEHDSERSTIAYITSFSAKPGLENIPNHTTGESIIDRTTISASIDMVPHGAIIENNTKHHTDTSHDHLKTIPNLNRYFICKSLLQLIPSEKRCNKEVDCEDGTDEDHCTCVDYIRNTNSAAICDGITDCFDGSDEINCAICDSINEYYCRHSKQCIPLRKRCNGIADCSRSEDEWDCAALTNGKTLTLDSDLRPELAMSGIITINRFGVWRPFCSNMSDNEASIVTNVCNLLGFEEYVGYHKYLVEDRPIDVLQKNASKLSMTHQVNDAILSKDENSNATKCSGLNVTCSVVSLDKTMHIGRPDNVSGDVELYTSPWNAVIYSDGIYRCMGTILDPRWIITSVNCFKGITTLRWHYITVILGTGKAQLQVQGPHEQIIRVVETVGIPNSDIVLLRIGKNMTYTRYVKNAALELRREGRRRERCIAIGLHRNHAKYIRLTPLELCEVGFRCFESNVMKECGNSEPWSGTIVCHSSNGWYPAAVYHEATGPCGLTAVKKYTSIPFYKNKILNIMKHASISVDAPPCDGFRCALGECINENKTCDGIPDCRSGEDEIPEICSEKKWSCHLSNKTCGCPKTQLKCKNDECVPKFTFCDGKNDCGDNSDEPTVCSCRAYLELTDPNKVCDGILNCLDRSDEDPLFCSCRKDDFNCISVDVCVRNDMVCDGIEDCPNGEDEKVCYDLSSSRGRRSNAGEVMKRTGGIWHSGCFNISYNTEELEHICEQLGFFNSTPIQLKPPQDIGNMTTSRPVIDNFDLIWIHRNQGNKFSLSIRRGNEPFVKFVPDDHCYRLFVACL